MLNRVKTLISVVLFAVTSNAVYEYTYTERKIRKPEVQMDGDCGHVCIFKDMTN